MDEISEDQVSGGTIISPPLGYIIFNKLIDNKFAEDPELTKTLYFTPSQLDQASSNCFTFGPFVSLGSFFFK